MPYFYRRHWYRPRTTYNFKRRYRKRWFRPYSWRPRKTIRRRRRKRRVRKRFYKRKLKRAFLKLKQWQPELIRKSCIKGLFTLFEASPGRFANNWPQYRDSLVPIHTPGGGGWGIFVFNLGAFFDEFLRIRNWWTVSNVNLPLVRYLYCKLRFYRCEDIDYVVYYSTNYPMTDSAQKHADAQPSRMLMRKHKIIVPSRKKRPNKKPYVKKKIFPPKQLVNRWFFQRDFINTNLLTLTATACDLENYDISPYQISNNIYLKTLNPIVFKHVNYHTHNTAGWQAKGGYYLYATLAHIDLSKNDPLQQVKYGDLIYLGQTEALRVGKEIKEVIANNGSIAPYFQNPANFGNIFDANFIHGSNQGNYTILVCNVQPSAIPLTSTINSPLDTSKFTVMTEPIYETITYNPDRDTGANTSIYFIPNFQEKLDWEPTPNEQLSFFGYPLWMLCWGWPDWQKKLALINQIDDHYILIIKTNAFEPKRNAYMLIDDEFINNTLEYFDPSETEEYPKPLLKDQLSWHPKFHYQQKSIDKVCMAGPGTCKSKLSIQAKMDYNFFFKWGGSSTTMETIADPSKQPSYPTPNNIDARLQIENPALNPETMLFPWDIRRDICTKKSIERLTNYPKFDETSPFLTESWTNPKPPEKPTEIIQALLEAQTTEKEKETKLQLLQQLRDKQQLLNQQLQQLILSNIRS
nr:MAG: ORF1 [TTV-like mini virus]